MTKAVMYAVINDDNLLSIFLLRRWLPIKYA